MEDVTNPAGRMGIRNRFLLQPRLDPAETAVRQVEALGYQRTDVRHIIVTHLDLDHAGGLTDFPHAKIHLHSNEYGITQRPLNLREKGRYRPMQWAHEAKFTPYTPDGEKWHGFDCARQLTDLPPEILLLAMGGHSLGHTGVAINRGNDWLIHAGDSYFHRHTMTEAKVPRTVRLFERTTHLNSHLAFETQGHLQKLVMNSEQKMTVFCSHDPVEYERLAGS
jgi:glyoxylase-like metal-dependent hydrolase (beta-lactamase superfamily II)